jgi:dTDP-glucose 4,6-dehydratase
MTRIAITGVTGFIGGSLAERLIELGHTVVGITRHCASRDLKAIEPILDRMVLLTADITDLASISEAMRSANPDCVCHLAALTPVRLSFEKPFEYERTNYLATMNICRAIMELPDYKTRKLVASSTAEVYGLHTGGRPLTEEDRLNPSSPYAVSKAAADMYLLMASRVYGLKAVVLRPVNTYGRRHETGFLMEYLITSMLEGKRAYIGAPESIREYMYVDDHVNAYVSAVERGAGGEAYNVSTMEGVKNLDLALTVAKAMGFDEKKIIAGAYPPGYPQRPLISDQPYIILDNHKAKQQLDWTPRVSLDEGIERTIKYWRSQLDQQAT